jgi:hypothetical protein
MKSKAASFVLLSAPWSITLFGQNKNRSGQVWLARLCGHEGKPFVRPNELVVDKNFPGAQQ